MRLNTLLDDTFDIRGLLHFMLFIGRTSQRRLRGKPLILDPRYFHPI